MDPLTLGLFAGAQALTQFGGSFFGANQKRDQARRVADATNRANLVADQNRLRLHNFQEDERMRLHNAKVDAYNRFVPRAYQRAGLAYQDNNARLKELIDQYQFMGQDRLAQQVAQQGALAARGVTGRGARTAQVAADSALGRGDALMADNLLRARYGTERANMKIRQQLTDSIQNAYNQVAYTPRRAPAPLPTPRVSPSYNGNDYRNDLLSSGFNAVASGIGTFMGGMSSMPGGGASSPYDPAGIPGMNMSGGTFSNPMNFQPMSSASFGTAPNLKLPTFN